MYILRAPSLTRLLTNRYSFSNKNPPYTDTTLSVSTLMFGTKPTANASTAATPTVLVNFKPLNFNGWCFDKYINPAFIADNPDANNMFIIQFIV